MITRCIIESCDGNGIEIYEGMEFRIINNKIQNNDGAAIALGGPTSAYTTLSKGVIIGNELGSNTSGQGIIELNGSERTVKFITISSNIIHCHRDFTGVKGVHLKGAAYNNTITGNVFDALNSGGIAQGIHFDDASCAYNIVEGNIFAETAITTPILDDTAVGNTIGNNMHGTVNIAEITTGSYSSAQTLTETQCRGGVIYVTGAAVISLPAIKPGMSVSVITVGDVAVSVNPDDADVIVLDGTALAVGRMMQTRLPTLAPQEI